LLTSNAFAAITPRIPASIANGASSIVANGDISLRLIENFLATTLN
jgi:hypothetical protein